MAYRNIPLIDNHIAILEANGFPVTTTPNRSYIITRIPLPREGLWRDHNGKIITHAQVLIPIPPNYPYDYPGVGISHPEYGIHIQPLTVNGKELRHMYSCNCKYGKVGWKWLCFEKLKWNPHKDNLYTIVTAIIASMQDRYNHVIRSTHRQATTSNNVGFFDAIKDLFGF